MSHKKYQIFISYRYVDADGFVADELHKALIDFKVPRSLRKNLANPEEYKIERLFQDKIKLSVAESLWDTIEEALSETEYLVVICSPRVEKGSWCYKEIETFINKNGTDRVIAVLAEGEPEDVIPDIMRANGKIPYAADVRGSSKKEIRKQIKEAIPRIVAPIFGLEYEQLHNKFQEELWTHKLKFMAGISGVVVAAAIFSTIQMLEAQHQKDIQEQQLKKIEAQMKENLFQQEKILTLLAENDMEAGHYDAAIENLLKGLPDDFDNPEYPIYNQACYDLSKALMIYEDGSNYSSAKKPFTDPETGKLVNVIDAKKIDENRMYLASAQEHMGYIWNIKEGLADFRFSLDFMNMEFDSDNYYNYFYDLVKDKNISVVDNVLYISDATSIRAISLDEYKILWEIKKEYTMALDVYDDIVLACNVGDIMVLNAKTGEILFSQNHFDDAFTNQRFRHAFLSKDKKSIIIWAEYDTDLEAKYHNNEILTDYEDYKDNFLPYLYRVSLDDFTLIEKKQVGTESSSSYWLDPNRDLLYVSEFIPPADRDSIPNQKAPMAKLCAYDVNDFTERWNIVSENDINQAYFFDNPMMKDTAYFIAANTIIQVSVGDGTYKTNSDFSSDILSLEVNDISYNNAETEYRLEVLCSNGSVFTQSDDDFLFSSRKICDFPGADCMFFRFGNNYVFSYVSEAYYYDITKLESAYGTPLEYDMVPVSDPVSSSSSSDFDEEQFGIKIVCKDNNHVDILKNGNLLYTYAYEKGTITEFLVTPDSRFLFLMFGQGDTLLFNLEANNITDDEIIKLGKIDMKALYMTRNPNEWIVMTDTYGEKAYSAYVYDGQNKTFEKYLYLQDLITYDLTENMIYEYCSQGYMKVPLYSKKELVELARNKK